MHRSRRLVSILGGLALVAIATSAEAWKSTDGGVSDDPGRECKRLGGRYLGNGRCELQVADPIARCKESGGILMDHGRCYTPADHRR